ncbi:MAG: glycosyltransferase [Methylotenera sp.]|nr:glycosyltransferase [Methylotenera sp.]MDP3060381.1 glycosyltransferase [Methylotenera sp.]MDP3183531.1 glycosyltransferase [Desulfobaccales bacterium]
MKLHDLKISVLLATFNGEAYLNEQLKSIENQLDVEVLIVVSDDGSSDHTPQLLNEVLAVDRRITLLPSQKQGGAAANFFRLLRDADLTQVDYVALADQDDIWQADKLSHAVQKILINNVDAYSSNVTAFWPNGSQKLINKAQPQQEWDYMFESAGPGCTFVLTQKLALGLQIFLIANQEKCQHIALHDWLIYAFARSRGFKWLIDHEAHMLYRQHAGNVVGANVGIKAKLARWQKLREGWLVKQALLIADILGHNDTWPIQKLKRYHFVDRLALIANVNKLRRRLRDRVALALFLLLPLKK